MNRWRYRTFDPVQSEALARAFSLPLPVAQCLVGRGFSEPEAVDRLLRPRLSSLSDPFELPGMAAAVDRLLVALARREKIAVFGDYDVDGVTATALLVTVLRRLGAAAEPFLPSRMDDGYGLAVDTLVKCVEQHRPALVVTVDCGTNAVEAAAWARANAVGLVVTDHHLPSGETAPAEALVNPRLAGPGRPWSDLAGVGVAFKVCHALVKRAREQGLAGAADCDLREWLDLVALGTVADIVPLQDENRVLTHYGLQRLNDSPCPGLKALCQVSGLRGEVESWHLGFTLGPRLNAAGRLGSAEQALQLLMAPSVVAAMPAARALDAANRDRQDLEKKTVEEACATLGVSFDPARDFGLVAAARDWHPGVIGIVASRLVKIYHRPAVVIALDDAGGGRGSCRSLEAFPLLDGLQACAGELEHFGGHAMAAGLTLRPGGLDRFRAQFNAAAARVLQPLDLRPVLELDARVELAALDESFYQSVCALRPFGMGHPSPVWGAENVYAERVRIVGERHLKMTVTSGNADREAIAFNMGGRPVPEAPLEVAFALQQNEYNGRVTYQLNVKDFVPAGSSGA